MILYSKINENAGNKLSINDLCKQIKVMRPGAVMQFIAKQFDMSSTEFVAKYALNIAKMAIKNGWVKTKDIGASIADFAKKNKEDVTGIDFSKAEIDPSTTKFKCLFDNVGDKFSTFMKDLENELKDEGKEIEKADKQLHDDVKKAGVEMEEKEIDDNGLAVASVIDSKKNKGKKGKELKKKIESAIKKDKQAKEIQKISKELKKTSSKVKVDKKYEKMSDEELAKLDDKINKKIRNRSDASKKNDAFRSKIKNAVQKGIAEDFKKSVKTVYVSTDTLKKSIASNMKPGLAVEQIKEPRAVCISVQCSKKEFGNVLKEADGSTKIIDVTNGSKDKSIQKVIDYIKKVLQDKIGKDKLGNKIYAYLKNSGGNCLLYVFAGVKQDELDESLLNEEASLTIDGKSYSPALKISTTKINNFAKQLGISNSSLYKMFGRGGSMARKSGELHLQTALSKFNAQYDENPDKAIKTLLSGLKGQKSDAIAELAAKLKPEAAEKFKDLGIDINGKIGSVAAKAADAATAKAADAATEIPKLDKMEDGLHSLSDEQFGERGFATYSDGKIMPSFSFERMSRQINSMNDMFADGKLDPTEMAKLNEFGGKLGEYSKWAAQNANSDDPLVKQKIAMISMLSKKYNDTVSQGKSLLDSAEAQVDDARTGATEATRAASKEMANDEEVKKAAGDWKEKLGLGKAFTALGWARLAAKTTGIVLNNGKAVVDALGAAAVKFKEDANVIAQMNFLLTNGEDNDAKFQDSKFSVRFSTDDMKWHATCLDDRKMKFDEDELIKKALDSEEGKKFKAACLKKWTSIFKPKDETRQVIPYIMKNFEKIGLKASDSNVNKIVDTVQKMEDNFSTIEKEFK